MKRCDPIRPLLYRVAEGEVAPDEAMRVARHVPGCTACRILLAREQRLAQLLESDLEDLNVDEAFVESVMATLPDKPSRTKARRGLKLAGLFGAVASTIALGGRGGFSPSAPDLQTPALDAGLAERVAGGIAGLLQTLILSMDSVLAKLFVVLPALSDARGWAIAALAVALAGGAALAAASCVTAGCLLRLRSARG